jgi:hypothetical protein
MAEQLPKAEAEDAKRRARWKIIVRAILKTVRVPLMCLFALIAGLMIGYIYIGGQQASEVFQLETWKHMFDLVFAPA